MLTLPTAIARYLDADRARDPALLAPCFTADAVVHDEGHAIQGIAAIQAWSQAAQAKYQCTLVPLGVTHSGDSTKLLAQVSGNFPGSPADLLFVFGIRGDQITALEIRNPVGLEGRPAPGAYP